MSDPKLSFRRLRPIDWVILLLSAVLLGVLAWQACRPFYAEVYYKLGRLHTQMQLTDLAIRDYEHAVRYAPWENHYLIRLGKLYEERAGKSASSDEKSKWLGKAVDVFQLIQSREPRNPWYRNRLASVYDKLADLIPDQRAEYRSKAMREHQLAAQFDSNNPLFQMSLAFFYHMNGQLDEAIDYYNRALAIDDRMTEGYYNLANIYEIQQKPGKILEMYFKVLEHNPNDPKINLLIAQFLILGNQAEKAIPFIQRQLELTPYDFELVKRVCLAFYALQKWDAARPYFRKYVQSFPQDQDMHRKYISVLLRLKEVDAARTQLDRYIQRNPSDPKALRMRRQIDSV